MDGQGGRELTCAFWMLADSEDQGDSGGEGGDPPGAAEVDLHGQGDVRLPFPTYRAPELTLLSTLPDQARRQDGGRDEGRGGRDSPPRAHSPRRSIDQRLQSAQCISFLLFP